MDGGPQEREQHPRGQLSVYETGESAATHPLHPGNPGLFSNEDRPVLLSLLSCPSTRRLTKAVVVDPRGSGRKGDLLISHPLPPRQLETHRGSRHGTGCPFPSLLTHRRRRLQKCDPGFRLFSGPARSLRHSQFQYKRCWGLKA